ncbi:DUF2848 domain-containing protein [Limimaricola hongkongensis]|uniref:DUF2848 domain-containing protein n=1 Tax=Limimaricola hongkongensis DSM 17492 TaxID=1122180 RepID=A0A017HDI4_9RHOB|nr:DUF2848 domain-containing protein [Limimaricola hongkongensis]EYD72213.1 hypothetical protein Lokhon_01005 [Limimaricola hongkongensis DSM 17492]
MQFDTTQGALDVTLTDLIVAGWTGRDRAAVDHHIEELAALGVAPPSQVPLYYRCGPELLVQSDRIDVLGPDTSGEAEPLLIRADGKTWLGLGSDQTDRALEAHSVAHSKQVCPKPVAAALWDFDEVADHLDRIELASEIFENGAWVVYQSGTLASIRPLADLAQGGGLADGGAMLCGTLGAKGGVRPAERFRMRLTDPVLGREIATEYAIRVLPVMA